MANYDICTKIEKIQKGDMEQVLSLLEQFDPLLKKYAFQLNSEDAYSDLRLFFIQLMKSIKLEKISNKSDGAMVNYIKRAVHCEYVRLIKEKISEKENQYIDDTDEDFIEKAAQYSDDHSDLFVQSLASTLSNNEFTVIYQLFYKDNSPKSIAKMLNTSQWNVYKLRDKAFEKLRKIL